MIKVTKIKRKLKVISGGKSVPQKKKVKAGIYKLENLETKEKFQTTLVGVILKVLGLPEDCKDVWKKGEEYLVYVIIDDFDVARIIVNDISGEVNVSFNYDVDPFFVAKVAIILSSFEGMEIYEAYRIDDDNEMLWWDKKVEDWVPGCP